MKTMEERAASAYTIFKKEVQEKLKDLKGEDRDSFAFALGFTAGVVLQRSEDTNKACEWLRKIGAFSTLSFHDEEGVSQEVYEDMFRKAMKGVEE